MTIKNQVQLITYPDALGGNLASLDGLLRKHFRDIFSGGVHILPPFPSSGDRGFAPLTYAEINPRWGTWASIRHIGENFPVVVDLMVNHISRQSPYFQDFERQGRASPYADLFITLDKIWPDGDPPAQDVAKIFKRRPENPFSTFEIGATGQTERVWTTFGRQNPSDQIDLDVHSTKTRELLTGFLTRFSEHGIQMVRLDAVGYVIKEPGTSCFMVEPEIYTFLGWLTRAAASLGIEVLPEVHAAPPVQSRLAAHGFWVYDFVLPLLVLHTLTSRSSRKLREYLRVCPRRQFTMLDCHDGIPVRPDLEGLLTTAEAERVVKHCLERGANLSRLMSPPGMHEGVDAHQINITYYSALEANDDAYIAARALQFFAPGVPQVYYVGLLAGENDQAGVARAGDGRAINRRNYTSAEVEHSLQKPVVQRLIQLIRFRNTYPAFSGEFRVLESTDRQVAVEWRQAGRACRLMVDLDTQRAAIAFTDQAGRTVEQAV